MAGPPRATVRTRSGRRHSRVLDGSRTRLPHLLPRSVRRPPGVTREIASAETEAAIQATHSFGIEYDSFIFSRNAVGHRDLLAAYGFSCYRSAATVPAGQLRQSPKKLLAAIDPRPVELGTPSVDEHGLVDIPLTLPVRLRGHASIGDRTARDRPHRSTGKTGYRRASTEDGVFHMWLHPNNLQTERDSRRLVAVLRYLPETREKTDLVVETMADVAAHTQNSERQLTQTIGQ